MNVSLTPELENFVSAKVETSRYNSASEVVPEALRLIGEHESARVRGHVLGVDTNFDLDVAGSRNCSMRLKRSGALPAWGAAARTSLRSPSCFGLLGLTS